MNLFIFLFFLFEQSSKAMSGYDSAESISYENPKVFRKGRFEPSKWDRKTVLSHYSGVVYVSTLKRTSAYYMRKLMRRDPRGVAFLHELLAHFPSNYNIINNGPKLSPQQQLAIVNHPRHEESSGYTLLAAMCFRKNVGAVKLLLNTMCPPEHRMEVLTMIQEPQGFMPLHWACYTVCEKVVFCILNSVTVDEAQQLMDTRSIPTKEATKEKKTTRSRAKLHFALSSLTLPRSRSRSRSRVKRKSLKQKPLEILDKMEAKLNQRIRTRRENAWKRRKSVYSLLEQAFTARTQQYERAEFQKKLYEKESKCLSQVIRWKSYALDVRRMKLSAAAQRTSQRVWNRREFAQRLRAVRDVHGRILSA
jgi:hypothetical protein